MSDISNSNAGDQTAAEEAAVLGELFGEAPKGDEGDPGTEVKPVAEAAGDEAKPDAEAEGKDGDKPLGEAGLKALLAERNKVSELTRTNAEMKSRLDALEDEKLPEADRDKNRATRAETELSQLRHQLLVQQVAIDKKLPSELAERLRGTTLEELVADADSLLKFVAAPTPKPKADPSQGAEGKPTNSSPQAQFAAFLGDLL